MEDEVKVEPKKEDRKKSQTTTVAIPRHLLDRLEAYCKRSGIMRKDFVELALEYFERTGYDLRSSASDLAPVQSLMIELQEIKETMQANNNNISNVEAIVNAIRQLPAPETMQKAADTEASLKSIQADNEKLSKETERLNQKADMLSEQLKRKDLEIVRLTEKLKTAIAELDRCGLFSKPSKAIIENLKEIIPAQ